MSRFWVHADAEADLEAIWSSHPESAAYLAALLEQLASDADLRDRLTQQDFGVQGLHPFHVTALAEHQDAGRNFWRLKAWNSGETIRFRIIYAYDHSKDAYHVLGVLPRNLAYDTTHERVRELVARYEELGLPHLPFR